MSRHIRKPSAPNTLDLRPTDSPTSGRSPTRLPGPASSGLPQPKSQKRKSLLPQWGGKEGPTAQEGRKAESATPTESRGHELSSTPGNTSMGQPKEPRKAKPPGSGMYRTTSLRRPTTGSINSGTSSSRIHTRSQSTQVPSKSSTTRPPSRPKSRGDQADKQSSATPTAVQPRSTLVRAPSTRRVTPGQNGPQTRSATSATLSRSTSAATKPVQPSVGDGPRLAKPAFNTMQQHFSPKKTTKAPTSSFTQSVANTGSSTLSSDALRLQTELLQLHILREASFDTQKKWERSGQRTLNQKFEELVAMHEDLGAQEQEVQEQLNLRALHEWTSGSQHFGLAENVHLLSKILQELPTLAAGDGRYSHLVNGFENWLGLVQEVWETRDVDGQRSKSGTSSEFADGLGDVWKAEAAALTRKLGALSREANKLNEAQQGSTVESLVRHCREMMVGMLDEIQLMQAIEKDVVSRERQSVEEGLKLLSQDLDEHPVKLQDDDRDLSWRLV